ncbi:MAG: hypothetical protein IJZ83_01755 [Clostridia bacterium]|nr:hypothetical protein [Clostridia bacterium]
MDNELPRRKDLRLKQHDYSSKGAYFVTICIQNRKRILSNIVEHSVGGGAFDAPLTPKIQLTEVGKIIKKYLLSSENIPGVKIDRYVIMPDHIHIIFFLNPSEYSKRQNGSSRAPTPTNEMIPHVVSTFKRFCNKEIGSNVFQRGYIEHIIRDRNDYETRVRYIYENPIRWYYDKLYAE